MNSYIKTLIAAFFCATAMTFSCQAQKFSVPGFTYETLYSGNGMTAIDFDNTGRMYVCEKQGRVLMFEPNGRGDYNEPVVLLDIVSKVNPDNESGLLGIAIDPNFATNRLMYIFYTGMNDQRLARYKVNPAYNGVTDEAILLTGLPRTAGNHKAGDIHFHPKDPRALYITLGDDTHRELVDDLNYYNGKLLRVDTATGKGLADNPFYDGNADSIRSRVWATGFRNPFRFTFDPSSPTPDVLYVSENGDGTDRVAQITRGSKGGWGPDGDKGLSNPPDKNVHVLKTSRPCLTGIAIAPSGPFASPTGKVLYYDQWYGPQLYRGDLSANGQTFTPMAVDNNQPFVGEFKSVNLKFGPDGALYTTQTYFADSRGNNFKLGRIKSTGGK